jgi:hypothetical protein
MNRHTIPINNALVNFWKSNFSREKAIPRLAGFITLVYIFSRFIPCTPPSHYVINDSIDNDWAQVLHVAFAQHLQFGRDIIFTYGPWGFLAKGYHPSTYYLSVLVWGILSLAFWQGSWQLARRVSGNLLLSSVWIIALTAFASVPSGDDINARIVAYAALLLSLHFFAEDCRLTPTQALLVVSLGLLSLVKFTGFLAALFVMGAITANTIFRYRRFPWQVPLLAGSLLIFWTAAAQQLRYLRPYIFYSWKLTSGYTEAMMRSTPNETLEISCFLFIALLLCALTGYILWKRHRFFGIPALMGIGGLLTLIFKQGFVRHDLHEISAATSLVVVSLVCLLMGWLPRQKGLRLTGLFAAAAAVLFAFFIFNHCFPADGLPRQLAESFSPQRICAPVRAMFTGFLRDEFVKDSAVFRRSKPLPMQDGDIYPYRQTLLFANDVPFRPRPVFHSYSVYSPELAELNAAHLRSDRAAHDILFDVNPIDSRLPALEDSRSWPELLTLYDAKDILGRFLLLTRAESPKHYRFVFLREVPIHFGEEIVVPSLTNGLIWAELDLQKSWQGTMVSAFYKPPALTMTVVLSNGNFGRFRIAPGMVQSGFLLSPSIYDTATFAELASNKTSSNLGALEVGTVMISAATKSGSTVCYRSPARLRFYRLLIQDAGN